MARAVYAVWRYNGHRLGDAINGAGINPDELPLFVLDELTDTFRQWDAATPRELRGA